MINMKKKILSILLILFSILLSSCSTLIDPHEHSWSKYYDDGDGNHTRTCLLDIEHTETKPHNFVEGRIVQAVEGNKCGLRKYTCKDCGYSEVRAIYPECNEGHTHKMDKNISSDLYLYEKRSEYSSIYYKSCSCGAYGDDDYLFEHNILNNQYSQIDYVITDKSNYIDLGLDINNNYSYSFNNQNNQSRLPSGYTEVNYIETTGNQIIDTGIKDDLDVTVDLHMSTTSDAREYWYGSMQNEHMAYNGLWWNSSLEYNYQNVEREPSNEVIMTQYLSGSNNVITINNVTTTAPIGTVVPEGNLYIFGCNNGTRFYGEGLRCYYFKIYKNNDMIRNFVPAIRNYDNASGLYDLCQNTFYISEDETNFKTGEEVMYQLTSRLPSGYSELEYIESTGTQFIDTGYKFSTSDKFELVITPLDEKLQCGGGLYSEDGGELYLGYRRWLSHKNNNLVMSNSGYLWESSELGSKKTILYEDKNIYVNDELKTTIVEDYSTNYNFYLFCLNRAGTPLEMSNTRFYRFKIYSDDVLIHDYVPARNISCNVGIYDLIENVFHANLGTGDFIEGNVISSNFSSRLPSGYQEVEYIKTDGTQYIDLEYEINGGIYCEYKASWQESGYIVGSHAVSDPYNRNTCYLHTSMHMEFGYGNLCPHSDASFLFNKAYNIEFSTFNNNAYCQVDGEILTFNQESYFSNENITGHLYLFTTDYNLNLYNNLTKGTLYSCTIKDCNGDLIFNLIPCINNNGVAGVYNTVNNKFYTSTIGNAFETGNVITYNNTSRLPSGYTELEYIESTGTQYINTGISLSPNIRSEIIFDAQPSNGWGKLYGYSQSGYGPYALYMQNSELKYYYQDPNGTEWSSLGNVGNKCTKVLTSTFANSYSGNIYINELNPSLTEYERPSAKWYSVKIYSDDILVRNFVPAKNSYDEVGLYDLITNTFYSNDGTGSFLAGAVVINAYTNPSSLPSDYIQLEYIESTKNQYIDTGVKPTATTGTELVYSGVNLGSSENIYYGVSTNNAYNDGCNYCLETNNSFQAIAFGHNCSGVELSFTSEIQYKISYNLNGNNQYVVDETVYKTFETPSLPSNYNIYLFCRNVAGSPDFNYQNYGTRIYSCKIYNGTILVRDFVPAKNSCGIAGLYDLVNNKFYTNDGSGEFIAGNYLYNSKNAGSLFYYDLDYTIPDKYKELSSITSSSSYIDTECYINPTSRLELNFSINDNNDSTILYVNDNFNVRVEDNVLKVKILDTTLSSQELKTNQIYHLVLGSSLSYTPNTNSSYLNYLLPSLLSNNTDSIYLLNNSEGNSENGSITIYSFKIYENNTLSNSFIPSYKISNDVIGLYDIKNYKFIPFLENEEVVKGINDNTSSLIDTEIKDIILPDQYIKKDYIESTGKQYIDTGIEYDANTHLKLDIEISYLDSTTKDEFMGFYSDMWYIYGRNSSNYFVGSPNLLLSNNVIYGTSVEFYQGSATYSYQGKTYSKEVYSQIDTTNNPTFTLFTTFDKRNDITSYTNNCRIYSIRVYEDECLIKYYVPCTEKNTFRNGLYDVINNEFISSSTSYNLLSGYSSLVNANLNSTNLLYRIYNESISCNNRLINNVTIYNSNNSVYMNLIPVIRNSDSTIGLYDTINNTFYPLNSNIDKGEILGHNFDEGVIIQNPTYNQQGITKYTCTLCGEELYEYTDKLSYKIEYDKDVNLLIKTYISNNDNEYMTSDTVYSRNIYTYNYSKVGSFVKFVVEDASLSVCASSGYLQKLDDTTYLLTDISEDCIIYIR